jgi:hypothetical protein
MGVAMRILFLGEIGPGQTSLMRMRAIERLGHTFMARVAKSARTIRIALVSAQRFRI